MEDKRKRKKNPPSFIAKLPCDSIPVPTSRMTGDPDRHYKATYVRRQSRRPLRPRVATSHMMERDRRHRTPMTSRIRTTLTGWSAGIYGV